MDFDKRVQMAIEDVEGWLDFKSEDIQSDPHHIHAYWRHSERRDLLVADLLLLIEAAARYLSLEEDAKFFQGITEER